MWVILILGMSSQMGQEDKGGLRYCINGVATRFVPKADMAKEGYAYLLDQVN